MTKLGIVTVLYNSESVIDDFFQSIDNQSYKDIILYLVDNSPNNTMDDKLVLLSRKYNDLKCIYLKSNANIGVAAGNNVGIKKAMDDACTHVLLANNDIEFDNPKLLESMFDSMIANKAGMMVPKILFYDSKKIWTAGGHFDKFRSLGVHDGIYADADDPRVNISRFITYSPTCFMLIDVSVFQKIGIMDEKYFVYVDDTDFVYRAIKNNIKLWYESSLTILHKVSTSTGGDDNPFYVYYSNRNKVYFIRKHYGFLLKCISFAHLFITRFVFYLKFDAKKREALVKAIIDGYRMEINKNND
jgi:GT2 family glycosyltransferase